MPDPKHPLSRAARNRLSSSHETIDAARDCLLGNRHVVEHLTTVHQLPLHDDIGDERSSETCAGELLVARGSAQVWLSRQLLNIADRLIETSRQRTLRQRSFT